MSPDRRRGSLSATARAAGAGLLLVGALALGSPAAGAASRFASYDSEADCVAARSFAPAVCRTAFANARVEYESRTPSFPSAALCARRFPSCMAWPPGSDPRRASYRPRWNGVDIVDTPTERSVTPAPGGGARGLRFAARPLTAEPPRTLVIRGAPAPVPGLRAPAPAGARAAAGPSPLRRAERAPSPSAPAGSGFRLEDGVLTYPAPERFQPRNLPRSGR